MSNTTAISKMRTSGFAKKSDTLRYAVRNHEADTSFSARRSVSA